MYEPKQLKSITESKDKHDQFKNSIIGSMLLAASDRKYQCQWYTPNYYECNEDDITSLKNFAEELGCGGYKTKIYVLRPNKIFDTTRVKITINWE